MSVLDYAAFREFYWLPWRGERSIECSVRHPPGDVLQSTRDVLGGRENFLDWNGGYRCSFLYTVWTLHQLLIFLCVIYSDVCSLQFCGFSVKMFPLLIFFAFVKCLLSAERRISIVSSVQTALFSLFRVMLPVDFFGFFCSHYTTLWFRLA